MFEPLYGWLQELSYYLILVTAVTCVLPSSAYRKYIRFFTGLVLILLLLTPVMNLFKADAFIKIDLFEMYDVEETKLQENKEKVTRIEVEDIVIGH